MDPIERITVGALAVIIAVFLLWAVFANELGTPS